MSVRAVEVMGTPYRVLENMHFNDEVGMYAKRVKIDSGEALIVSKNKDGPWSWWMREQPTPLQEAEDVAGQERQVRRRQAWVKKYRSF